MLLSRDKTPQEKGAVQYILRDMQDAARLAKKQAEAAPEAADEAGLLRPEPKPLPVPPPSKTKLVFSAHTRMVGDVVSSDDIDLCGELTGSLTSTQNVTVSGRLRGPLTAARVMLSGAATDGDILSTGAVYITAHSSVCGNITADEIYLEGGVSVLGDLTAPRVCIEPGAQVVGRMNIG